MTAKPVHCAAVDLGATSGRVIVGSWHRGRLGLVEVHRFSNQFRPLGGHEYWDLPYLWAEVQKGLLEARMRYPRLASVGVDTWAVDHALVDARGRLVHPVYAYRDARTQALSSRLERRGIGRVYALTGIPNYPYNTSLQLQETLEACPEIAEMASRCLFLPDYFNFLLSGRMENEISVSSHSQLLDLHGLDWSAGALAYFGVPRRWFTSPARSPRRLGKVTGIPGLSGILSILVPGHDTACAFTAMPAAADGSDLYLSSGTWSLLGFESNLPVSGPEALTSRISNERMGDGRYRPLRSCLGLWLLEQTLPSFASRPKTPAAWERLIAQAIGAPKPDVLIDVTDASLFKPAEMRAAIDLQLKANGSRPPRDLAGYVRLICDSLGRGHAEAARTFERLAGRRFGRILIVGGGSRNKLLCQATADAARLPVASLSLEGAAVGNIACQLVALGAVKDVASFRRHLSTGLSQKIFKPQS
ncbi:MAG: FGGY-family carbohydrate kinase [Opitutaceae bacterium]